MYNELNKKGLVTKETDEKGGERRGDAIRCFAHLHYTTALPFNWVKAKEHTVSIHLSTQAIIP
jgi:hypothetical protein